MIQAASNPAADLLQGILNASLNAVLVYEAVRDQTGQLTDLRITYLNRLAEQEFTQPIETILHQPLRQFLPDPHWQQRVQGLGQVLETGQPIRHVVEVHWPGHPAPVWLDVSAIGLQDAVVVSYVDVTTTRQTEQEVAALANQNQILIDNALTAIARLDAVRDETGTIVNFEYKVINRVVEQLSGLSTEQLVGKRLLQLFPGTKASGLFDKWKHVVETGEPLRFVEHYQADGIEAWYDTSAVRWGDGLIETYQDISALKRAERNEQQQAHLLRLIIDNAPNGMILVEAVRVNGQIVDFCYRTTNKFNAELSGYTVEEMIGQRVADLFPGYQQLRLFTTLVDVTESGEPQQYLFEYNHYGVAGWFDGSFVKQDDGVLFTFMDVTALKQAELANQQQAETLRSILNGLPVGLFISETVRDTTAGVAPGKIIDFRIVEANPLGLQNNGFASREAVVGQLASALFPPDRHTGQFDRYVAVLENQQAIRFEFSYPTRSDTGWIDSWIIPHGTDQAITISLDITSLKQALLANQAQAETLDRVFNASLNALAVHRTIRSEPDHASPGQIIDFQITQCNELAARWMKLPVEEILERPLSAIFPDFQQSRFFQTYTHVVRTGEPARFEWGSGGTWYEFLVAKLGDGFVVSTIDITENRQYRRQLERANDELLRSNESLQQFAYIASHDLQEPLRKIMSFGDVLLQQYATRLGESGADIIGRMQASAHRMSTLITDLLSYSRVSTERKPARRLSLTQLLNEIIDDLGVADRYPGARVTVSALPDFTGDPAQLRQLFQNLLSNALKFQQPGQPPVVVCQADWQTGPNLPAPLDPTRTFHCIRIQDNGIGFDEKYLDRIFQVFQRLHGKNQYVGTGVGLAICRRVAENHGGLVTANSQPGQGATFRVYLPVNSATPTPASAAP